MTYIALITILLVSLSVALYLLIGRQGTVDSLIAFMNFFVSTVLISYYIELKHSVSFEGSIIAIFGVISLCGSVVFILVRQKSYRTRGNSNIEG